MLASVATAFFSGQYVALAFYPEWLKVLAWSLPFAAMIQAPIEVFLGHVRGVELAGLLALQAFWATALLLLGRALLGAGLRKLVIQGG
jgi:ABC-2 type transport system permease protein